MNTPIYTITNESIIVVVDGTTYTVTKGAENFQKLRSAIAADDWSAALKCLSLSRAINEWGKGKFAVIDGVAMLNGNPLPNELNTRILAMVENGEDPEYLFKFWEKLQKNHSRRSVEQLWSFLEHAGIPITKDGMILAYKSVRSDFKDHHTGTIDNSVGQRPKMRRNEISDDPGHACHRGLHVGALEYASTFGGRDSIIVICEVDPANVVCVPYDHSSQKMRVCEYRVAGVYSERLSSTTYEETLPVDEEDTHSSFDKLSWDELIEQSMDELRKYASRTLKIVGASRLPGGKDALIDKIISVRGKKKKI